MAKTGSNRRKGGKSSSVPPSHVSTVDPAPGPVNHKAAASTQKSPNMEIQLPAAPAEMVRRVDRIPAASYSTTVPESAARRLYDDSRLAHQHGSYRKKHRKPKHGSNQDQQGSQVTNNGSTEDKPKPNETAPVSNRHPYHSKSHKKRHSKREASKTTDNLPTAKLRADHVLESAQSSNNSADILTNSHNIGDRSQSSGSPHSLMEYLPLVLEKNFQNYSLSDSGESKSSPMSNFGGSSASLYPKPTAATVQEPQSIKLPFSFSDLSQSGNQNGNHLSPTTITSSQAASIYQNFKQVVTNSKPIDNDDVDDMILDRALEAIDEEAFFGSTNREYGTSSADSLMYEEETTLISQSNGTTRLSSDGSRYRLTSDSDVKESMRVLSFSDQIIRERLENKQASKTPVPINRSSSIGAAHLITPEKPLAFSVKQSITVASAGILMEKSASIFHSKSVTATPALSANINISNSESNSAAIFGTLSGKLFGGKQLKQVGAPSELPSSLLGMSNLTSDNDCCEKLPATLYQPGKNNDGPSFSGSALSSLFVPAVSSLNPGVTSATVLMMAAPRSHIGSTKRNHVEARPITSSSVESSSSLVTSAGYLSSVKGSAMKPVPDLTTQQTREGRGEECNITRLPAHKKLQTQKLAGEQRPGYSHGLQTFVDVVKNKSRAPQAVFKIVAHEPISGAVLQNIRQARAMSLKKRLNEHIRVYTATGKGSDMSEPRTDQIKAFNDGLTNGAGTREKIVSAAVAAATRTGSKRSSVQAVDPIKRQAKYYSMSEVISEDGEYEDEDANSDDVERSIIEYYSNTVENSGNEQEHIVGDKDDCKEKGTSRGVIIRIESLESDDDEPLYGDFGDFVVTSGHCLHEAITNDGESNISSDDPNQNRFQFYSDLQGSLLAEELETPDAGLKAVEKNGSAAVVSDTTEKEIDSERDAGRTFKPARLIPIKDSETSTSVAATAPIHATTGTALEEAQSSMPNPIPHEMDSSACDDVTTSEIWGIKDDVCSIDMCPNDDPHSCVPTARIAAAATAAAGTESTRGDVTELETSEDKSVPEREQDKAMKVKKLRSGDDDTAAALVTDLRGSEPKQSTGENAKTVQFQQDATESSMDGGCTDVAVPRKHHRLFTMTIRQNTENRTEQSNSSEKSGVYLFHDTVARSFTAPIQYRSAFFDSDSYRGREAQTSLITSHGNTKKPTHKGAREHSGSSHGVSAGPETGGGSGDHAALSRSKDDRHARSETLTNVTGAGKTDVGTAGVVIASTVSASSAVTNGINTVGSAIMTTGRPYSTERLAALNYGEQQYPFEIGFRDGGSTAKDGDDNNSGSGTGSRRQKELSAHVATNFVHCFSETDEFLDDFNARTSAIWEEMMQKSAKWKSARIDGGNGSNKNNNSNNDMFNFFSSSSSSSPKEDGDSHELSASSLFSSSPENVGSGLVRLFSGGGSHHRRNSDNKSKLTAELSSQLSSASPTESEKVKHSEEASIGRKKNGKKMQKSSNSSGTIDYSLFYEQDDGNRGEDGYFECAKQQEVGNDGSQRQKQQLATRVAGPSNTKRVEKKQHKKTISVEQEADVGIRHDEDELGSQKLKRGSSLSRALSRASSKNGKSKPGKTQSHSSDEKIGAAVPTGELREYATTSDHHNGDDNKGRREKKEKKREKGGSISSVNRAGSISAPESSLKLPKELRVGGGKSETGHGGTGKGLKWWKRGNASDADGVQQQEDAPSDGERAFRRRLSEASYREGGQIESEVLSNGQEVGEGGAQNTNSDSSNGNKRRGVFATVKGRWKSRHS